ncbi:MAG: fibronectin type III domain-containing protein [Spirochaetota bacterium]
MRIFNRLVILGYVLCLSFLFVACSSDTMGEGGNGGGQSVPGAPDVPIVTAASEQLTLSWTAVIGATAYEVWYNTENNSDTAIQDDGDISGTSHTITELTNGTTYYVWLKAKNSAGTSGFGAMASGTPELPLSVPDAPGTPSVIPGDSQLSLSWGAVTGATAYEVWYNTENNSGTSDQHDGDITDLSHTITGLTNGTTYYVWLKAKNSAGTSGFGAMANGAPLPIPAAPGAPTVTSGNGQLALTWTAVTGATAYEVWYNTENNSGTAIQQGGDITSTNYTITGLANGTEYYIWLKAKNSAGTSGFGAVANAETNKLTLYATNTFGTSSIQNCQIAALTNGNYVIIYQDNNDSGKGKFVIVNSLCQTVKEQTTYNSGSGSADSAVASLNNGNFVVAYRDYSNSDYGTFIIYDSSGTAVTTPAVFYSGDSRNIAICTLINGNFVLAFRDSNNSRCLYMIYNSSGTIVKNSAIFLNNDVYLIMTSPLTNGNFVIGYSLTGSQAFVVFNSAGATVTSGTVNTSTSSVLSISQISNGNFVFVYSDSNDYLSGKYSVYSSAGVKVTGPITFESNSGEGIDDVSVALQGDGNFALIYQYEIGYYYYNKLAIYDSTDMLLADINFSSYTFDNRCRSIANGADGKIAIITRSGYGHMYVYEYND